MLKIGRSKFFGIVLFLAFMPVLYTVFAVDGSCEQGTVIGKVCHFHRSMPIFAAVCLVMASIYRNEQIPFSAPDCYILLLGSIVLTTYDHQLHPEPLKMLFGGQVIVLWFSLRKMLTSFPFLKNPLLAALYATTVVEAAIGLCQLYGHAPSLHSHYKMTGTFYNPGPFSGYLAILLPVGLFLRSELRHAEKMLRGAGILSTIHLLSLIVVFIALPAGMSRTAWIAAAVSCTFVFVASGTGFKRISPFFQKHRKHLIIFVLYISTILFLSSVGLYHLKKDSADGRLLMWKIEAKALMKNPRGTGLGGFPKAYADTQVVYFASGGASEREKLVAGCPEYAFNEYLQIGIEEGIMGLLLFAVFLLSCLRKGIKNRQYGAAGGLLSLSFFALPSYPLQLPSFWIAFVILGCIALSDGHRVSPIEKDERKHLTTKILSTAIPIALCLSSIYLYDKQRDTQTHYRQWKQTKMMYQNKSYASAVNGYTGLYPHLSHQPAFLFEGAQCLIHTGKPTEAAAWLERAEMLSCDPMLCYVRAQNEQERGNYTEAEQLLLHSIDMLPERIYPYYLLAKLYADPNFYNGEKLEAAADTVLYKKPKVESTAIKEMRIEVRKLKAESSKF